MRTKIVKGTQAQILDHLQDNELGFATDTKAVFIRDGVSKRFVGKCLIDTTVNRPTAGVAGRFFYDTTLSALFVDNGSTWVNASLEGSTFVADHEHTEADITDLGTYADAAHTHTESDITDLGTYQTALSGTSTLADLGIAAIDPAFSGALTGITTASTLLQVLTALDAHTHS